jgi:hypothetical protein
MHIRTIVSIFLAGAILSGPALAQRHADIVYLQQQKAKHAREMAENAKRKQEVAVAAPEAPVPAAKPKPSAPATAPSPSN